MQHNGGGDVGGPQALLLKVGAKPLHSACPAALRLLLLVRGTGRHWR